MGIKVAKLPPYITTKAIAERYTKRLLKDANKEPPTPGEKDDAEDRSFEAAANAYRRIKNPRPVEWMRIERLITCKDIGPVHVADLSTDQAAKFAAQALPGRAPDTMNREIITPYSAVLHYAYSLNWRGDPLITRFQEEEDEVKAVTRAEVDQLLANVDATGTYGKGAHKRVDKNVSYKVALIEYLRLRGSRISDVLSLQRERDLDLKGMQVRLTIGKARKKVKWLPLSPRLVAIFANLPPCEGDRVFPWRSRSSVYKWLKPLCQRLDINVTPHQFRHALAEEALDADVDLLVLQNLGAWASLKSVKPYARVSKAKLERADEKRAHILRGEHREMELSDFMTTAEVVPLKKPA